MRNLTFGVWIAVLAALLGPCALGEPPEPGALDTYVAKPDGTYGWVKRRDGLIGGRQFVELTLTSQRWRQVVWKHQLYIVRPTKVRNPSRALLVIAGGRWRDQYAHPVDAGTSSDARLPSEATAVAIAAEQIGSPIAVLLQVPFQPIFDGLVEDEAIAYTFDQYLDTRDPTWPLLLPMVKSAVRAMDAVQGLCLQEWDLGIEHFTVTGASKRGWTTWLTAAVDRRVQALAPMVIDMLNMQPQMEHQVEAWGGFSSEIAPYTDRRLPQRLKTPEGESLRGIVDPYAYRARITQPKLIFLGTNDPYWPVDALNLYWDGLVGPKYIVNVPNAGHGLEGGLVRVLGGLAALHRHACGEMKLPDVEWRFTEKPEELALWVKSDPRPAEICAWVATSPTRDFRTAPWRRQPLDFEARGGHGFRLPIPEQGFAACFAEATFHADGVDGAGGMPYFLSTPVRVVSRSSN